MRISTSSYLFGSSIVLALGLYFRERSSTLYTVITAGEAVKFSSHAAGKAVIVELGLAAGRAASCRLATARQQGVGSAAGEAAEVEWQCGASVRW